MTSKQLRRARSTGAPGADDSGCHILHVDMDAFYASVSLLDHPELVGRPVVVGGSGSRGVVLSATYEARACGIHSAMPIARARRLAPEAIYLEPDFQHYSRASAGVMEIFASITPAVQAISMDEAFLEVTGARRRLGSATAIAELIRARVADEQGITCSVGVAPSKLVAKMASSACKPDGLLVVPADRVIEFLHPQPVAALWGVGEKTEERLIRLGLRTIGDVAAVPAATLQRVLGPAAGSQVAALAWGRDPRRVGTAQPRRSVGADETFARDVDDPEVVHAALLELSTKVAVRLRRAGLRGRTVSIRVRFADFTTVSRSRTLADATDVGREIYRTATALYETLGLQRARLRLVGVRVEQVLEAARAPEQLALDQRAHGWRDVELAADRITTRFGRGVVGPARLLAAPGQAALPDPNIVQ